MEMGRERKIGKEKIQTWQGKTEIEIKMMEMMNPGGVTGVTTSVTEQEPRQKKRKIEDRSKEKENI